MSKISKDEKNEKNNKIEKISTIKNNKFSKISNQKETKSITKVESKTPVKKTANTSTNKNKFKKKGLKSNKKTSITKKNPAKKHKKNKILPKLDIIEYYDLPYKYGHTIVKLLAQTPKTLFVYWEISDKDIEKYKNKFGDDFFNLTKPILIVRNLTLNTTYEVEINDFANCWYLNIETPDCKFDIELARKFISSPLYSKYKKNDYLYIAKSNSLTSPNNHILFEKLMDSITLKNTKTGERIVKDIKSYSFLKDLYNFYKDIYKDELLNPSSNFLIY